MVKFQKMKKNLKHNHRNDKTFRRIRSDIDSLKPAVLQKKQKLSGQGVNKNRLISHGSLAAHNQEYPDMCHQIPSLFSKGSQFMR